MIKKTNVMRILDSNNIKYTYIDYQDTGKISGIDVATVLNENPKQVFKTLVTEDLNKNYFVFLVPVEEKLNLKKAAKSVNVKNVQMLKQKDLFSVTGYIHGGCSPVGMKKVFPTVIDSSSKNFSEIYISGGKIGKQILISLEDLKKVIEYSVEDIIN